MKFSKISDKNVNFNYQRSSSSMVAELYVTDLEEAMLVNTQG